MGLFDKFRKGLKKTREEGITAQIEDVVDSYEEITDELYEELEEILIMGDVGFPTAEKVIKSLKEKIENDRIKDVKQVRETLKDIVSGIVWGGSYLKLRTKPSVILVIGVNGVGKTTTIGKLSLRLKEQGRSVILGAADTFRAAAIEQLQVWADRAEVDLTKEVLLVLDATTGQNAVNQAKDFKEAAGITGIVLTKLDGTARGGVVLAINNELDVPVKFVGVGEQIDDLQPFDADAFAAGMFDSEE
ncbi:MAG: signal recognition particle-docking protein FtsY [Eubacterium sp.]|nr:signal recognition particle-docking protein FtsY [Eubacterium sp.]